MFVLFKDKIIDLNKVTHVSTIVSGIAIHFINKERVFVSCGKGQEKELLQDFQKIIEKRLTNA